MRRKPFRRHGRRDLRLSPLFIRFSEPERFTPSRNKRSICRWHIATFSSEDDNGRVTSFMLHARKGWRKRSTN